MAFIKIGNLKTVNGRKLDIPVSSNFQSPFGYYQADINALMAQNGARSLLQVTAKCIHVENEGTPAETPVEIEVKVLIACTASKLTDEFGGVVGDGTWIKDDTNIAALPCPRFDRPGAVEIGADGKVVSA